MQIKLNVVLSLWLCSLTTLITLNDCHTLLSGYYRYKCQLPVFALDELRIVLLLPFFSLEHRLSQIPVMLTKVEFLTSCLAINGIQRN